MLSSAETIEVVAKSLQKHDVKTLVIDPVRILPKIRQKYLTDAGYGCNQWFPITTTESSS